MMLISLQLDSETPLYEQLRNQIVLGIAKGQLKPDEGLPTVRQLAEDLGINSMTVNKAYALLKQENYISIDRRHGAKINQPPYSLASSGAIIPQLEHKLGEKLEEKLELIIAEASLDGIAAEVFQQLCARIYSNMSIERLR